MNFASLAGFFGIGATIRIGREMHCLPYAGFLKPVLMSHLMSPKISLMVVFEKYYTEKSKNIHLRGTFAEKMPFLKGGLNNLDSGWTPIRAFLSPKTKY